MQIPSYEGDIQGETWKGGPTHHVQRQHIPRYGGHVHGLISENQFGKPYARITADCLNDRVESGFIIDEDKRLQTTYGTSFNPDEKETKEALARTAQNYMEGMKTKLEEMERTRNSEPQELAPIDRLPVVGYQGFRPVYRNPVKKHVDPPKEDLMTTKQLEEFNALNDKTKQSLLATSPEFKKIVASTQVPIVGYTGFVKGQKARNMYGKSFKDVAGESKMLL